MKRISLVRRMACAIHSPSSQIRSVNSLCRKSGRNFTSIFPTRSPTPAAKAAKYFFFLNAQKISYTHSSSSSSSPPPLSPPSSTASPSASSCSSCSSSDQSPFPSLLSCSLANETIEHIETSLMEVSQKMEIEKKRKRLESLTQSLEEEQRGENDTHVDGDIHPLILEAASLSSSVGQWDRLALEAHHLKKIGAMARQEGEEGVWEECEERIKGLEKESAAFRTQDVRDCYLEIRTLTRTKTDAEALLRLQRMYGAWATSQHDFKLDTVYDHSDVAAEGPLSLLLFLRGTSAYGWTKLEAGIHEFITCSPASSEIPTPSSSFSSSSSSSSLSPPSSSVSGRKDPLVPGKSLLRVRVLPCAPESSAPSHPSTTTSTPLPADSLLGDPLNPEHEDEKCADKSQEGAREGEEGREALCRTYVLYPHALIKDHRTGLTAEGLEAEDMLKKGDIDAFIEAALTQASMTKSEEDKGGRIGSREEEAKLKYVGGKESSEDDREDVIEKIGANQDNDEKREGTEGDATEDERDEEQE